MRRFTNVFYLWLKGKKITDRDSEAPAHAGNVVEEAERATVQESKRKKGS